MRRALPLSEFRQGPRAPAQGARFRRHAVFFVLEGALAHMPVEPARHVGGDARIVVAVCEVERRFAEFVDFVQLRRVGEKRPHRVQAVVNGGDVQRRAVPLVLYAGIRAPVAIQARTAAPSSAFTASISAV